MMIVKKHVLLLSTILLCEGAYSQSSFSGDPDSSVFSSQDIDNFWKAFDHFKRDTATNPFGSRYLKIGSAGVKGFIPYRIKSDANLLEAVKKRTADYERVRPHTLRIKEKEKQCRSTFYALKYWYPDARFPPVYFVIGAYNSGGTSGQDGIIIGAEKLAGIDGIPFVVAHELIHFQQKNWPAQPTLLQQSIIEGSADFLGELISGGNINQKVNDYGDRHRDQLCKEFVEKMDGTNYTDWLYGVSEKDDRPADLGYWVGYKITEHYFKKAADKKQAVNDILNIKDYKLFLSQSGWLNDYL